MWILSVSIHDKFSALDTVSKCACSNSPLASITEILILNFQLCTVLVLLYMFIFVSFQIRYQRYCTTLAFTIDSYYCCYFTSKSC